MGWWLYEITGSLLAIGLIGLAEVLPVFGFVFQTGYIIDRIDKRKTLLTGSFFFGVCVIALLFLSQLLIAKPALTNIIVVVIYIIIFCTGVIRAFAAPTFQAITADVVPKEWWPMATTWNSATWLFGSILGHAIAGFSIAYLGVSATLIFIASLIFGSFYMLFLLFPKPVATDKIESKTKKWHYVKEGVAFVFNNKVILGAVLLDLFVIFFGSITAIIPAVAKDVLKLGSAGFAWLNAAPDIGSAILLIYLIRFPIKRKQGIKLFITMTIFGCSIIAFAVSRTFLISFIALFISGIANAINSVIRGTIVQLKTPNYIRGRVMVVNSLFTNSSNELGRLESGLAAFALGTMPSVLFGGVMTLFVVLIIFLKTPNLRKLEY